MGLFVALSGVVDAPRVDVQDALAEFAQGRSGGFELAQESADSPNIGVVTRTGKNATILYPDGFCEWDDASKHISARLGKPVFSLHIHDGDLWMFILFQNGEEISRFNPVPGYWEEVTLEEKARWKGDASLIAGLLPDVPPDSIAKYFVEWDLEQEEQTKAYPTDEFASGDCWQMCDFMKKLGLEYPMGADGSIMGDTFRLWTKLFRVRKERPRRLGRPFASSNPRKPWWRFW